MDQRHRTEEVVARVGIVVRDNHAVDVVTLEGDGVGGRLADVIVGEVEILIGAGTQMEGGRAIDTAIVQSGLHFGHRGKVGVRASHRVVPVQQTVAGVPDEAEGIAAVGGGGSIRGRCGAMETVRLTITGVDVNGDIIESVRRREVAQTQGATLVETEGACPGMVAAVRLHVVLVLHFQGHTQTGLVRTAQGVRRVALVLEIEGDRLLHARYEAVREGAEAVQMTVVAMDVALVMPSNERRVDGYGHAAVHITHTDLVADGIIVANGGHFPLGQHGMRSARGGVRSNRVRDADHLAAVDAVTELQAVHLHLVVVGDAHLDGIGSDIVQQIAVLVDIYCRLQGDDRLDQLAVREDALQVVDIPTRASLGTRRIRGGLVDTETDTDVRGRVVNTRHRHHLIHHKRGEIEELVLPPIVVGHGRHRVGVPNGVTGVVELTRSKVGVGASIIERIRGTEGERLERTPLYVAVGTHIAQIIHDVCLVHLADLTDMVELQIEMSDILYT